MNTLNLILQTGPLVKLVLVSLVFSSLLSWAVIFFKWKYFKKVESENNSFLNNYKSVTNFEDLVTKVRGLGQSTIANVFFGAYSEYNLLKADSSISSSDKMNNLTRALKKSSLKETLKLENKLPILASIASVAPFVGLFGTVWGIMNSFQGLAQGGPATLQRVAPGISEALVATAVGLAAAIPAVIFYNIYVSKVRELRAEMENFSSDFCNNINRKV